MDDLSKKLKLEDLLKTNLRYIYGGLSISFDDNGDVLHINLGEGRYIDVPIDISKDIEIGVEDRSRLLKAGVDGEKTYYQLQAELEYKKAKAEFDAEVYKLEELDGKLYFGKNETKEQVDKVVKYYEMQDDALEAEAEIFNLKRAQSLKIPLESHQAAFEIKKDIVKKLKELKKLETSGFIEALKYQGIELHDAHERNWCSSSAECNHVMHPHEDITDKLK